jgi:hypothetical protein
MEPKAGATLAPVLVLAAAFGPKAAKEPRGVVAP